MLQIGTRLKYMNGNFDTSYEAFDKGKNSFKGLQSVTHFFQIIYTIIYRDVPV